MSLLWKILLPIITLIVILTSVTGYVAYNKSATALETAVRDSLEGEVNSLKRMVTYTLHEAEIATNRIVKYEVVQNFFLKLEDGTLDEASKTYINKWLLGHADDQAMIDRFNIFDTKGTIIASSLPSAINSNFKTRAYFTEALSGKLYISKPFQSQVTGKGIILLSMPIKLNNTIVGVMSGIIGLDNIYELAFKEVSIYENGYAYAVNAEGVLLIHKNPDFSFKNDLPGVADFKRMGTMSEGIFEIINASGNLALSYFIKEPITDMTLIVQAEKDDAFASLKSLAQSAILVVVSSIIIGIALLLVVILPIIKAIKHGVSYAEDIAAGKLDGELTVKRNDELGVLANALRSLPRVLKSIIGEYDHLQSEISVGKIEVQGDASKFSGDFSHLVHGTNAMLSQYQGILNALTAPVVILNKDLRITYINENGRQITGINFCGKTCGEIMAREDFGTPQDALTIAAKTLRPATAETVAHPQGKSYDISYTAIPFMDAQGKLATVLQLITDLTAIKSTQRTIMDVASQAQDISARVAASSSELASQVDEVSRGADVQRERASSTAIAMEEMNSTVLEVARNAGEASQQAEFVRTKADESSSLVNQVVDAVLKVNAVASELEKNMQQLGVQAENIGSVMNVISDIADQTNLLALNAAIEAARAGEAGRGFAVVADEVRKLAEKTMTATAEVGVSIKGIQASTHVNIQRVGEAATGIGKAADLASISGEALSDILVLVNANSALITSIATAAEEQSATSEKINTSIDDINRIANETAEGMGQSATSVQELAQMAQDMRVLLDRLKS